MGSGGTRELHRDALGDCRIGDVVTVRNRELTLDATLADAKAHFASSSVQVLPVLDGGVYVGSVARDAMPTGGEDTAPLRPYVADALPIVDEALPAAAVLDHLDRLDARRAAVVDVTGRYVGLVCVRSDRKRLCVDAECHVGD